MIDKKESPMGDESNIQPEEALIKVPLPKSERQVRRLTKIKDPEERAKVWPKVVKIGKRNNEKREITPIGVANWRQSVKEKEK